LKVPEKAEIGNLRRMGRGTACVHWRSPYLRWRIETYGGLHAEQIAFSDF
jgi:hypothetical protein